MNLRSRLQDELIGEKWQWTGNPSTKLPDWHAAKNTQIDEASRNLDATISHIAADVEGLVPNYKEHEEWCIASHGSAYCDCPATHYNQAVDDYASAIKGYFKI